MKRIFAFLLCICMVFTMVPVVTAVNTGKVILSYENSKTYYDTVEQALAAAKGGTVSLQQDMTAGQVIVPKNVTLDLNGFTLIAGVVIVMEGQLADSKNGTGKLVVSEDMLAVTGDNGGVLPIWDPDNSCYVFARPSYQQLMNVAEDLSYAKYIFVPYLDGVTTAMLADGGADNGISVKVLLTWNEGASQQIYTFSDELVAQVYSGNYALVFQLTITGFTGIEDMTVCAVVESSAGGKSANTKSDILHNYGDLVAQVPATCTENGRKAYYQCTLCESYFDENKVKSTYDDLVIPALGHTYGDLIAGIAADCTATGVKEHYQCSVCDRYFDKNQEATTYSELIIPASGHNYGTLIAKIEPDYKNTGLAAHYLCADCGKYFDENKQEVAYADLIIPVKTEPAAGSVLTIKEAVALGMSKGNNVFTTNKYYVTGVITEVYNTSQGNMYIADEAGNIFTIYRTYNANGTVRYSAMSNKPVAGDTVTVYGIIGQYSGTAEMKNGWITEHIPGSSTEPEVTVPPSNSVLTIEEAIALGISKAHNAYTTEKYYVTGVITEVYNTTYGNMRLADQEGNILTVFGTYSADGKTRYDAMTVKPVAGDTVTVYGIIGQYNGTPQMKNGWITEHILPQPEETEPAATEPAQPLPDTVMQATCNCGDRFADTDKDGTCDTCRAHVHYYTVIVTVPTCNQGGYSTYICECDHSYVGDEVAATGKHSDSNKDKLCDWCRVSVVVELDFYSVNDLHGAFMDTSGHPGVDEFTTYMKQKYADNSSYEILLSSGDMWQGSVESSSNKGALMTDWMNELGFVSMTVGNHEYDWGSQYIATNMQKAEFPLLGINIQENGVRPDYCQPSVTVERGGVKIGIIGAIGDHTSSISGEFNQNLTFLSGSALTNLVKNESTRLRQQEGCDLIVYALHDDDTDYDVSLSNGYVDLVFEAHTHQSYVTVDSYGVVHIQSGGYNEAVSFVNIAYNIAEDTYVVETKTNLSNSVYGASSIADDPFVAQIYKVYFPGDDPYTTVLGRNASTRTSSVICQQIAKQYLAFGEEHWKEYDIVLAGGYLKLREPYNLYAGNVTYAQLFSLMPFDNSLVLGKISGSNLKSKFINSSTYTTVNSSAMPSTINNNEYYYIIVDTYTAYYASNRITIVDRFDDYYARDLIADFVKSGGWN